MALGLLLSPFAHTLGDELSMKRIVEAKLIQISAPSLQGRMAMRTDLHLARKVWHMGMGILIVVLYLAGISRTHGVVILGSFLGLSLFMETARLRNPALNQNVIRFCGPIMRSCEIDRYTGIPYYLAASILAIAIFPQHIAALSILYLAIGDPIASLVGILHGHRGIRFANGKKSLIGTVAGVVACMAVTVAFLPQMHIVGTELLVMTLVGGFAGGAAELLPLEVDDNFSIPVVSGFVLWFSSILFGI